MITMGAQRFRQDTVNDIRRNFPSYLIVVFCFLVGVTAGVFAVASLQADQYGAYEGYLKGFFASAAGAKLNFLVILLQSLIGNLLLFALIIAAGLLPILLPVSVLALVVKGFFLGFSLAALVSMLGFAGILVSLVCILLPAMILVPCYIKAASLSLRAAVRSIRYRMRSRSLSYLREMSLWFVVALFGILVEALAAPAWLKLCSAMFNG